VLGREWVFNAEFGLSESLNRDDLHFEDGDYADRSIPTWHSRAGTDHPTDIAPMMEGLTYRSKMPCVIFFSSTDNRVT
jgi:hypothetical protein